MFNSHPALNIVKGGERDRRDGSGEISLIERVVRYVLVVGDAFLTALRWAGCGEKFAQLSNDARIRLLAMYVSGVMIGEEITFAIIFRSAGADVSGRRVKELCCDIRIESLSEESEEWGAMVRVGRESSK